jgi:hypothetical protein
MASETVKLRIGSLARAVLITGQAYQDPKDALNEFVSNAADEYAVTGQQGERIRIVLRRKGRYPLVAIDDDGRGMSPDRLREVARNLFKSEKVDDERTLGEKAIGLLAFQQLGGRCEIVSRAEGSTETWTLKMVRGNATAELGRERRRPRSAPGTNVYVSDLDPEVLRTITQRKVVDYLRRRRGPAIERGDYVIEVHEGRTAEVVTAEPIDGIKVPLAAERTLWGTIEFNLFVSTGAVRRTVGVVGRANTAVLDDICEIEELAAPPWDSGQVAGYVSFPGLQQSAGRRAVLRDREAFPLFVEAVRAAEGHVSRVIERVNAEVDSVTADRMTSTLRKVFGQVLRELADLDNPMRTLVGDQPGEGALAVAETTTRRPVIDPPSFESLTATKPGALSGAPADEPDSDEPDEPTGDSEPGSAAPGRPGFRRLPSVAPDPDPGEQRSRFDPEAGTVLYNDRHTDYLLVKDNEAMLLDYLATLVAKEYVVYNNPLSPPDELAEEMVRLLIRVRRLLPRRR